MRFFAGGSRSGFSLDITRASLWLGVFVLCSAAAGGSALAKPSSPKCSGFNYIGERMKQAPIAVLVKALEVGSIDKETGLAEGMFELVHIWKGHISSKQFYVPVYSATFISEEAISVESGKYYVMNLEPDVAAGADHYKRFGCVPILETGKPSPENPKIKYINEHFIDKTRK